MAESQLAQTLEIPEEQDVCGMDEVEEVEVSPPPVVVKATRVKRKRKAEENELQLELKRSHNIASAIRSIGLEKLADVSKMRKLVDVKADTPMIILSAEIVDGKFGQAMLAECAFLKDGSRGESFRMFFPARCLSKANGCFPCCILYRGRTEGGIHRVEMDLVGTESEILKRGAEIQAMSAEEIERTFGVGSFGDFSPGTVMVYTNIEPVVRKGEKDPSKKIYIMSYECVESGKTKKGRVFLPAWIYPQVKKTRVGVIVYKGKQIGKNGRDYFDLQHLPSTSTLLECE